MDFGDVYDFNGFVSTKFYRNKYLQCPHSYNTMEDQVIFIIPKRYVLTEVYSIIIIPNSNIIIARVYL